MKIEQEKLYLIERKHSKTSLLPSQSDIKDGLLKMILYTNLKYAKLHGSIKIPAPILLLTSPKIKYEINSNDNLEVFEFFCSAHQLNTWQKNFLKTLFNEAQVNKFIVTLRQG